MRQWTSLAAFVLVMLCAGAADGLMEALGPALFLLSGAAVLGAAWALVKSDPCRKKEPRPMRPDN